MIARTLWRILPFSLRHFVGGTLLDRTHAYFVRVSDTLCDNWYGVNTRNGRDDTVFGDARKNIPMHYVRLFALRKRLRFSPSDIVVDLGSGDGRALFVFARSMAGQVRGIENGLPALTRCRKNLTAFRLRDKIQLISGDCAMHRFTNETVIYLYNPFGASTLHRVIDNLHESLQQNPRQIRLCFYLTETRSILDATPWLVLKEKVSFFKGAFLIYENDQT